MSANSILYVLNDYELVIVKLRKSLQMAFEDDTPVEDMRPFTAVIQNYLEISFEFGPFQGIFGKRVIFKAKFFLLECLTKKFAFV